MRWRALTAAVLLAGILLGGLWCRAQVEEHCKTIEHMLAGLSAALEQGTLPDSGTLDRALLLWEERLPFLSSLLDHEQLEQVGVGLSRASGCLRAKDRSGCLEQLRAVLYLLDDIGEYDHISLKTLL